MRTQIMGQYRNPITQNGCPLLCGVSLGIPNTQDITSQFTALLDTGAYYTLVGQGIADLLKVKPNRTTYNFNSANGTSELDYYDNIEVILPKGEIYKITITCARVYYDKLKNPPPFQLAIGMDILTKGTFFIDGSKQTKKYILNLPKTN